MILGIILNLLLSLWIIPKYIGKKRKIGFVNSLLLCVFLTPVIGIIIILFSPKLDEHKRTNIRKKIVNKELKQFHDEKINNLKSLNRDGLLSQYELDEKVKNLENAYLKEKVQNSSQYKQLYNLYMNEIFTEEEFNNKVEILTKDFNLYADENSVKVMKHKSGSNDKSRILNENERKLADFEIGEAMVFGFIILVVLIISFQSCTN